ncbi:Isotrichodermin C-15 hydroxylase [Rhypophila decipiens]
MTTNRVQGLHFWNYQELGVRLSQLIASFTLSQWLLAASGILLVRTLYKYIYNAFFHPLAKYPGPKLGSFSNIWEAYHLASGRWPWDIEAVLNKYGDVVRIAPDSLVFVNPNTFHDIHGPKRHLNETFIKTPSVEGLGDQDDGLLWERDPERHRRVSKLMSPAFSASSLRSKVPVIQKYVDMMMERLKDHGSKEEGVDLTEWLRWMCMDSAADLSFSWEMDNVKNMKTDPFIDAMEAANITGVIHWISKYYPIVLVLAPLVVPWAVTISLPSIIRQLRVKAIERMDMIVNPDKTDRHPDYFDPLLPADQPPPPKTKKTIGYLLTTAGQMMVGAYDPTSVAIWMLFYFLLQNPDAMHTLINEVRSSFHSYDSIEPDKLRTLPWLNACMQETLRLGSTATHHSLPRHSPGATVNGEYIPKGTTCRYSMFTYSRSSRFFHDAKSFRPERWLASGSHEMYNPAFANDDHSAFYPFILGPRQCPGREVARVTMRLVCAKMFWLFDVEQLSKRLDFDRDLNVYGMWVKPDLRVRVTYVQHRAP